MSGISMLTPEVDLVFILAALSSGPMEWEEFEMIHRQYGL